MAFDIVNIIRRLDELLYESLWSYLLHKSLWS